MNQFTNVIVTWGGRDYRVAIDAATGRALCCIRIKQDGSDGLPMSLTGFVATRCIAEARDRLTRRTYRMWRANGDAMAVVMQNHGARALPMRLDLANHSPTGFEWGYAGSGPAQLALAILADALGDDEAAMRSYQRFKATVVAAKDRHKPWTIHEDEIQAWIKN